MLTENLQALRQLIEEGAAKEAILAKLSEVEQDVENERIEHGEELEAAFEDGKYA